MMLVVAGRLVVMLEVEEEAQVQEVWDRTMEVRSIWGPCFARSIDGRREETARNGAASGDQVPGWAPAEDPRW